MEDERMPKVNVSKDSFRLTASDLHYMKRVEAENLKRVNNLKKSRSRNRLVGCCLGLVAVSIYSWTIYAVKQEKFLDDFDEPAKVADDQ